MNTLTAIQRPVVPDTRLRIHVSDSRPRDLLEICWRDGNRNYCGNGEIADVTRIFENPVRANPGEFSP